MAPTALGVVMPVYNERSWVGRSIAALHEAARLAEWPIEVVVVDDGSDDGTETILDEMAESGDIRVIHQPNRGRFEARRAGIEALETESVLLLDSRVVIDAQALRVVRLEMEADPSARVWNGHVHVVSEGNLYGAFWSGITKVGWRAYFAEPRRLRYGVDHFNRYPKGTGMFLAPRDVLQSAGSSFRSMFDDVRLASDDTRMIREIAGTEGINLSPGFSCLYYGRDTFQKWLKQSAFRGTTFVDGYLGDGRRAPVALGAAAVAIPLGMLAVIRRPMWVLAGVIGASSVAAGATRRCGGTPREAVAVGALLAPFAAAFASGLLRGLVLATRSRS